MWVAKMGSTMDMGPKPKPAPHKTTATANNMGSEGTNHHGIEDHGIRRADLSEIQDPGE